MTIRLKIFVTFFIMLTCCTLKAGDEFCGLKNHSFQAGEVVKMMIYYNTLGIYVSAGEANFTTNLEKYNGKIVYHCIGEGHSYPFFDNFYKVRDRYETYIDTGSMLPVKFLRNVEEGGRKVYNNVSFNHSAGTAVSTNGVFRIPSCIQDVISSTYYARNINYDKYKPGDKINFDMFIDDEIYHLYLRYSGKEIVKTRYGKFKAIKFKPLLIQGTIFTEGENMNVWVSDDENHIVLRVEAPISVGTMKVDMMGYRNLRYPLKSLLSFR